MKCCPACGQTLPAPAPAGVKLTPLKTRLFEAVRRAGPNGISTRELFDVLYSEDPNGGPEHIKTIAVHVNQINKKLKPCGKRIYAGRGNGSGSGWGAGAYVLTNL